MLARRRQQPKRKSSSECQTYFGGSLNEVWPVLDERQRGMSGVFGITNSGDFIGDVMDSRVADFKIGLSADLIGVLGNEVSGVNEVGAEVGFGIGFTSGLTGNFNLFGETRDDLGVSDLVESMIAVNSSEVTTVTRSGLVFPSTTEPVRV